MGIKYNKIKKLSNKEIAKMQKKRHKEVKEMIEKLLQKGKNSGVSYYYKNIKKRPIYNRKNTITLVDGEVSYTHCEDEAIYDIKLAEFLQDAIERGFVIVDNTQYKNAMHEVFVELDKIAGTFV